MRRERSEKAAALQLIVVLFGNALGISSRQIEGMLDLYLLELTQERYRPDYLDQLRRQRKERLKKKQDDQTLLQKVGKLTVEDADLPPIRGRGKRRK